MPSQRESLEKIRKNGFPIVLHSLVPGNVAFGKIESIKFVHAFGKIARRLKRYTWFSILIIFTAELLRYHFQIFIIFKNLKKA